MGIVSGIVASSGGTDVSDATAKAYDIKTGKTAYIATGSATGTGYFPAMMTFDGASYYSDTTTSAGNLVTAVCRFKIASFTGTKMNVLRHNGAAALARVSIEVGGSDDANADFRNRVSATVLNSAGSLICRLFSNVDVADGSPHTVFFSFSGTAGAATFIVDGAAADNASATNRVAPTAGTLDSGASSIVHVGANHTPTQYVTGSVGFVGLREAYLTNYTDFMQTDGTPKDIDETNWTEWSGGSVTSPLGSPLFWHESGKMDENKGSAGAMTANGTIILAAASTWS